MSQEQRAQVVRTARSFVGAKWRHLGRRPHAMDCIGLLVLAFEAAGMDIKDRKNYGREPWNDGLQRAMAERFGPPREEGEPWLPGDVAVFRWKNKDACHVGILGDYLHGGLSIIHAHSNFDVAEHGLSDEWLELLVEVYNPWGR